VSIKKLIQIIIGEAAYKHIEVLNNLIQQAYFYFLLFKRKIR